MAPRGVITKRTELEKRLIELRMEHRDLDEAISALSVSRPYDTLKVQRLKKRKLGLKDEIVRLEGDIYPDIIA